MGLYRTNLSLKLKAQTTIWTTYVRESKLLCSQIHDNNVLSFRVNIGNCYKLLRCEFKPGSHGAFVCIKYLFIKSLKTVRIYAPCLNVILTKNNGTGINCHTGLNPFSKSPNVFILYKEKHRT